MKALIAIGIILLSMSAGSTAIKSLAADMKAHNTAIEKEMK